MEGARQDIEENYKFLNNQEIDKNVQEINGYIYPREKSYTIGEISTNESWPRLLQAINFNEIKNTIKEKELLIPDIVFRLNSKEKFGFDRSWNIVSMTASKHLGYAFQWFSLAIALTVLTILFFVRKKDE
jgi:cytochrome oxidase assembly protein ShyY1